MKKKGMMLSMMLLMAVTSGWAQSGKTGSLTWVFKDDMLTISGQGAMPDYVYPNNPPWYPAQTHITTVVINNGVTNIGNSAFSGCDNLFWLTIPNSITNIGDWAFSGCCFPSITIPDGVTNIGAGAFEYCSNLRSLTIGNRVISIGEYAFAYCSNLVSVTIPDGVTNIGKYAFALCNRLTSVTIGNSVTSIGNGALFCSELKHIYVQSATPPAVSLYIAGEVHPTCVLHVPAGSKAAYKVAPGWKEFTSISEDITGIALPKSNPLTIYPNPVTDNFRINGIDNVSPITVSDISGKTVLKQTVSPNESVSVSHLPKGVYIVNVNGWSAKIIK